MSKSIVAPSILSADLGQMAKEFEMINQSAAEWIHIDVMDGNFVPPISFGDNFVKLSKKYSDKYIDTHLMVEKPENHIESFLKAGSDNITIHLEASEEVSKTLKAIKASGANAGLAIKPETSAEEVFPYLEDCDLLLVMTVNPGWSGQSFIADCLPKIVAIKNEIINKNLSCKIEVDGGIDQKTGLECFNAGAEVLVSASYIFSSQDPITAIDSLKF